MLSLDLGSRSDDVCESCDKGGGDIYSFGAFGLLFLFFFEVFNDELGLPILENGNESED